MYVYIHNWSIIGTSDEYLPIDTEVIETSIEWPIEYFNGSIIEKIHSSKYDVMNKLICSSDISSVDLEWITFSNVEIGDIIQARVFGGNPHSESALQAKVSAYIFSVMSGEPNEELRAEIEDKQNKVNEVRLKLWLSSIL